MMSCLHKVPFPETFSPEGMHHAFHVVLSFCMQEPCFQPTAA